MAEGEEQEDKEEEDKEKREKRKERAAKRRAPTEKRKRPQTTRRIFHFLLLNTCGRRARKKNRIPTHEMHFSSTLSQKQTKKQKNRKQKNRGAGEEDKKTRKKNREKHRAKKRSVAEKKKEVCRTAGSVLAWRKRRKTPPLCSTTQGTNARDTGKR
jgi:hypothetical protein